MVLSHPREMEKEFNRRVRELEREGMSQEAAVRTASADNQIYRGTAKLKPYALRLLSDRLAPLHVLRLLGTRKLSIAVTQKTSNLGLSVDDVRSQVEMKLRQLSPLKLHSGSGRRLGDGVGSAVPLRSPAEG